MMQELVCSVCGLKWSIDMRSVWVEAYQDDTTGQVMCKEHLALAAGFPTTSWIGNDKRPAGLEWLQLDLFPLR